jgi:hypothetical protein
MKNREKIREKIDNPVLENAIAARTKDGKITCAEAMRIAAKLKELPLTAGGMLDQMEIHIIKCQLGLFGWPDPQKKTIPAVLQVSPDLEEEIRKALQNDRLPCIMAWSIARRRKIPKRDVSAACEYLKIKIKPCQFGAF